MLSYNNFATVRVSDAAWLFMSVRTNIKPVKFCIKIPSGC